MKPFDILYHRIIFRQLQDYLEKPTIETEPIPSRKIKEAKKKSPKPKPTKSLKKNKLKRPPTKYILFCENEQKKIMEEKTKISLPDLGKGISVRDGNPKPD